MSKILVLADAEFAGNRCSCDCPHRTLEDARSGTFPYCRLFGEFLRTQPPEREGEPRVLLRHQACLDASALHSAVNVLQGDEGGDRRHGDRLQVGRGRRGGGGR